MGGGGGARNGKCRATLALGSRLFVCSVGVFISFGGFLIKRAAEGTASGPWGVSKVYHQPWTMYGRCPAASSEGDICRASLHAQYDLIRAIGNGAGRSSEPSVPCAVDNDEAAIGVTDPSSLLPGTRLHTAPRRTPAAGGGAHDDDGGDDELELEVRVLRVSLADRHRDEACRPGHSHQPTDPLYPASPAATSRPALALLAVSNRWGPRCSGSGSVPPAVVRP